MHEYPLRIAEEFSAGLAAIYSEKVLSQIRSTLEMLTCFPEIGSTQVRPCLIERYGTGIRKIPLAAFVIIYRFDDETIDVLSIVHGRRIV